MRPQNFELKPNRSLLNPNFEGYKVSLKSIPTIQEQLETPVDRLKPDTNQYSILHAKLFGLHNHLIGECYRGPESVYFVDESWKIQKYTFDILNNQLVNEEVWEIPSKSLRKLGDFNVSIKFISSEIVALADGMGCLYLLNHAGLNSHKWQMIFVGEVIEPQQNFIVVDARQHPDKNEVHLLLAGIKLTELTANNSTILHWITITRDNEIWNQTAMRQLEIVGYVQYSCLESNCEAIYVASDTICRFTLDSENEINPNSPDNETQKRFTWTQTANKINLKFSLPGSASKIFVSAILNADNIKIKYDGDLLLEGNLYQRINTEESSWTYENGDLDVFLQKAEIGLMWSEVVEGSDNLGEYIVDPATVEQVNNVPSTLTSDSVNEPPSGLTFNSQQIEECDFECDHSTIFQRLDVASHRITHKGNLGSHQVLLTVDLEPMEAPAFGIRSDVDCCVFQPKKTSDGFSIEHKGTLNALGYIQASKPQRKFLCCSPDMNYFVISETSKHLFIYFQNRDISSSELRNRTTGRRINTMAQQLVIPLPTNDEVLGIYSSNTYLYVLTQNYITALKI